jgi:hypothetical protein
MSRSVNSNELLAGSPMSQPERLPNLIVAGVSKAGTSSLFEYLGRHPDIGLSNVKEVRYFLPLRRGKDLGPLADYAVHFAHCTQRYAMEATPGYFYGGSTLAFAMQTICDYPRVIVSLREPVSRCWSWYRFEKSRLRLPKQITFDDYLDMCFTLHAAGRDCLPEEKPYWGVGGGCYDRWLDEWIEVCGTDLKVIFFDELVADPEALLADLLQWLDLDPRAAEMSDLKAVNATQEYRAKVPQTVAVKVNRRGEQFFRRHPRTKKVLRSTYYALNCDKRTETMSAEARTRLETFYHPHNTRLARQLDRIGLALPVRWHTGVA